MADRGNWNAADDDFCDIIADTVAAVRLRKGLQAFAISDELRIRQAARYRDAVERRLRELCGNVGLGDCAGPFPA